MFTLKVFIFWVNEEVNL